MTTATIGKWGNASAIRLPKPFCELIGVEVGDAVRVSVEENRRIVIEPTSEDHSIQARMAEWNGVRYHCEEFDWGDAVGEELW